MITIENDDDAYQAWLNDNPQGFVINTEKVPRCETLRLHRVSCSHISTPKRSNWTTGGYLKMCSNSIAELDGWAREYCAELPACQICHPRILPQTSTSLTESPADPDIQLPFRRYPQQGRALLGKRSVTNCRRGYGLTLRELAGSDCCVFCGLNLFENYHHWLLLQVDHVIPTTMGLRLGIPVDWLEDYSNAALACSACNSFQNHFDALDVTEPPQTLDEFFDLRDAVFRARLPGVQRAQEAERGFFERLPNNSPAE